MHYSVQPRDGIFAKGYGFLTFAKNIGKNISQNVIYRYNQKRLYHAKQSATDVLKAASKSAIIKNRRNW